jgi:hypothetical protein
MNRRQSLSIVVTLGMVLPMAAQVESKSVRPLVVARRVALVIGNSAYRNIPSIEPAINDANDIARTLRALSFDVVEVRTNLSIDALITEVDRFSRTQVKAGDLALIYYSGHGGQVREENYLLPVDYDPPADEVLVSRRAYPMSQMRDALEAASARVRVLIFDACRSSPITTTGAKGANSGLREMNGKPEGTIIAYASGHNQVALYNSGQRNSFYTAELLSTLGQPGTELKGMLEGVQYRVYEKTGQKQTPYLYGFLSGPLYLGGEPARAIVHDAPVTSVSGSLLVSTDSAVSVSVDGESPVWIAANDVKRFPVVSGSHILVAASLGQNGLTQRKLIEVRAGEQQAVILEFAGGEAARRDANSGTANELQAFTGLWTTSSDWQGKSVPGDVPYHAKTQATMQISANGSVLTGVWKEHETLAFTSQTDTYDLEGTFRITRQGNEFTGLATNARFRVNQGAWESLASVPFTGSMDGADIKFRIVWRKTASGEESQSSVGVLTRGQQAGTLESSGSEAEAGRRNAASGTAAELQAFAGLWTTSSDWQGNSVPLNVPYHAKTQATMQISANGSALTGVWQEHEVLAFTSQTDTYDLEGTFRITRQANQFTGMATNARFRVNQGAWESLPSVPFTASMDGANIKFRIVWRKTATGAESQSSAGVLTKQ